MIIASSLSLFLFLSRQNSLSHCVQIRAYQNFSSPSTRKSSVSTAIYINVTLSYIIVHYHIIKWRRPRELSRSKNNNDKDICLLVDTRGNLIILDATHLVSRYARDFISFLSLVTNLLIAKKTPELLTPAARYTSCDSVILLAIEFRQTQTDIRLSESTIHLSSPSTDYLRVAYHRARACARDVKPERLHG